MLTWYSDSELSTILQKSLAVWDLLWKEKEHSYYKWSLASACHESVNSTSRLFSQPEKLFITSLSKQYVLHSTYDTPGMYH